MYWNGETVCTGTDANGLPSLKEQLGPKNIWQSLALNFMYCNL